MVEIKIKRVYDKYEIDDGYRIFVDRLWPRGMKKDDARIDLWFKDIAPSDELRKWFAHDPHKWEEFKKKYFEELDRKSDLVKELVKLIKEKGKVTFLFSAKEKNFNNCVALREYILNKFSFNV